MKKIEIVVYTVDEKLVRMTVGDIEIPVPEGTIAKVIVESFNRPDLV